MNNYFIILFIEKKTSIIATYRMNLLQLSFFLASFWCKYTVGLGLSDPIFYGTLYLEVESAFHSSLTTECQKNRGSLNPQPTVCKKIHLVKPFYIIKVLFTAFINCTYVKSLSMSFFFFTYLLFYFIYYDQDYLLFVSKFY